MIKDNNGSDSTPDNRKRQFCRWLPYSWSNEGSLNFYENDAASGLVRSVHNESILQE